MVKHCKLFKVQSISVIFVSKFGTFSAQSSVQQCALYQLITHLTHIFLAYDLAQCEGQVPTSKTIPPQIRSSNLIEHMLCFLLNCTLQLQLVHKYGL